MRPPASTARNKEIYAAFRNGQTVDQLTVRYGLSKAYIVAILNAERNKVAVSPEPDYRAMRRLAE